MWKDAQNHWSSGKWKIKPYKVPLHTHNDGYNENIIKNVSEYIEKSEPYYIANGNVKWYT